MSLRKILRAQYRLQEELCRFRRLQTERMWEAICSYS